MNIIIRPAFEGDVEHIYSLIAYYASEGVILERSREDIRSNLEGFLVAEVDGRFAGSVTHYGYGEMLKEVRSLAVHRDFQGLGIGSRLLFVERNGAFKPRIFPNQFFCFSDDTLRSAGGEKIRCDMIQNFSCVLIFACQLHFALQARRNHSRYNSRCNKKH